MDGALFEVGKQGEQAVILIHQWLVLLLVWVYEQFGHRDGGSDGSVVRPFEPREDFARQIDESNCPARKVLKPSGFAPSGKVIHFLRTVL